jgi:hypothetical protein
LPVLPGAQFIAKGDDLIVLSSEVFEYDMWQDLEACRKAGGMVLGVYHPRHISEGLMTRLSSRLRVRFGGPAFEHRMAGGKPAIVFWDSHATPERTWRLRPLHKLSASTSTDRVSTILATHSSLAASPASVENLAGATLAAILEIDTHAFEADVAHESGRGRTRLRQVVASTTAHALEQLRLGRSDTLVLMSPSPTECRALAAALSEASGRDECPAVIVELSPLVIDDSLEALAGNRLPEFKEAIDTLADATDERFTLVTLEAHAAEALRVRLERPIDVMLVHDAGRFLAHVQTLRDCDRTATVMPVDPTVTVETLYATAD